MSETYPHIVDLAIRDYRGLAEFNATLLPQPGRPTAMLVIGGPNGSGKTSVLEAALLALGADKLLRAPASGPIAVRRGAVDYSIDARFGLPTGDIVREVHRSSRHSGPRGPSVPVAYFSSWRAPKHVGALPVTAGRGGRRPDKRNEDNRLWIIKQYLINAKVHSLMREEKQMRQPTYGYYEEIIHRLNTIWGLFYPKGKAAFRVEEIGDDPDEGFDLCVSWAGQPRVSVDQLSSGQQEILTVFGWLVCERLDGGIVVIDEPELHLDSSWHRLILQALCESMPRSQFIVATHSREVFESVDSFQRVFLSPRGGP